MNNTQPKVSKNKLNQRQVLTYSNFHVPLSFWDVTSIIICWNILFSSAVSSIFLTNENNSFPARRDVKVSAKLKIEVFGTVLSILVIYLNPLDTSPKSAHDKPKNHRHECRHMADGCTFCLASTSGSWTHMLQASQSRMLK